MWSRRTATVLLFALSVACSDDGVRPPPIALLAETCDASGTLHAGTIGSETWHAADNPHGIVDTLRVTGVLTLDAGVEVCIEPDVPILIDADGAALHALGTADDSIVFAAGDPARPWGGIRLPESCTAPVLFGDTCTAGATRLDHARIEHATFGVDGGSAAAVRNSHIRQIRCVGASARYIAHTRVDTAGIDGCPAVVMGQAAVQEGEDVFMQNHITGSGGEGLHFYDHGLLTSSTVRGRVALVGGRIEGSRGIGIAFGQKYVGGVSQAAPIRITGGDQAAFVGPWATFAAVWPTAAALDSLRGNAGDSIVVWQVSGGRMLIPSGFTFRLEQAVPAGQPWAELQSIEVLPGSRLAIAASLRVTGRFLAEGTRTDPIHIAGPIDMSCGSAVACDAGSRFAHVEMDGVQLYAYQQVTLDTVVMRRGTLFVSDASRLTDVHAEDAEGNGIAIGGSNVTITGCRISRSLMAGIVVYQNSTGLTVHDCAIEQNGGPGIQNLSADTVDARFNWWGDPNGPLGAAGDGIEGDVDYSEFLVEPPATGASVRAGAEAAPETTRIPRPRPAH